MPFRPLTGALKEKARTELNEDPQRIQEDLQHIKDWLSKQPHIRPNTDDQWLLLYLRGCKFRLEKVKQKLDLYYTLRSAIPENYQVTYKHPKFMEIYNLGGLVMLPKTWGDDTPFVVIIRPGVCDPNKFNINDVTSVSNTLYGIALMDNDNASVAGFQSIMDLEGTTMAHFLQMTPIQMKKISIVSQDASPVRMKGFHHLNTPPGFETIFNAFKPMLNEKNRKRLYVENKNYDELYKHVPKEILPAEYGGNGGTISEILDYWRKKIEEYAPFLDEQAKCGVDESKRPGKPKTSEELFGVDGSFRQLEFD